MGYPSQGPPDKAFDQGDTLVENQNRRPKPFPSMQEVLNAYHAEPLVPTQETSMLQQRAVS